jgi:hypothetical protein
MRPLPFPALHSFKHCCSVNNNIEQHNSIMEVNEDGSNLPMILANKIE